MTEEATDIAVLKNQMGNIEKKVDEAAVQMAAGFKSLNERLDKEFVTRKEFLPVRAIAFGLIAVCMLSLMGIIISSSIKTAGTTTTNVIQK